MYSVVEELNCLTDALRDVSALLSRQIAAMLAARNLLDRQISCLQLSATHISRQISPGVSAASTVSGIQKNHFPLEGHAECRT